MTMYRWKWLLLVVPGLLPAFGAQASPVALVTEVSGQMEPGVEEFTELQAGSSVILEADAEIVFLHYRTCESVTVRGGRLLLTAERYTVQSGRILDARRTPCPRELALGAPGEVGGVVLRATPGPSDAQEANGYPVAATPSLILVGSGAAGVTGLRVEDDAEVILEVALRERRFSWPDGVQGLVPGRDYNVQLLGPGGCVKHRFAVHVRPDGGATGTVLVRID